jgi:hypothetical protein
MSDSSTAVTDASAFQERSLGKQVLFTIVTLGLYSFYWWHITHQQLNDGTDADFSPVLRTVGLFIPFYNFLVMWRTSHDAEAVVDQDGVILFLLFLVFAPAAWYLIQSGINETARGEA